MKRKIILSIVLSALLVASACNVGNHGNDTSGNTSAPSSTEAPTPSVSTSDMFSKRDLDPSYDAANAAEIVLSGNQAQFNSKSVTFSDGTLTITDEGTYVLSGSLENGMIIIDADDADKVQLVFNGVSISASNSAAIYALNADKLFITLADGTENAIVGCSNYVQFDSSNIDAAIFSKCDLTFNGSGSLAIQAPAGHGIVTKDDLVVASGNYAVTAASHGFSGKDSIRIAEGSFAIDSGKDGLHSENSSNISRGFVYIASGSIEITSAGDGISASNYLILDGGSYRISSGGGSSNTTPSDTSCKGLKADGNIKIDSVDITIDSCDDAIHSNADIIVKGGDFNIMSGDDGLHADDNVTISGGEFNITKSSEGIEGHSIDILNGTIRVVSDDDGLNASGGNDRSGFGGFWGKDDMFSGDENAYINISGGFIHINAGGDGIDSNGSITVSGGETYISGPTDGGNGAVDYASNATISGGIFLAAGSSQMAAGFGNDSTQGAILVSFETKPADSKIVLTDSNGNTLIDWTSEKPYSSVVLSCPELAVGSNYTLTVGGSPIDITMSSIIYSSGGMGRPGGMGGPGGGIGGPGGMGDHGGPGGNPGGMGGPDGTGDPNGMGDPGGNRP
ncbi:MAG: carbohydrate-binding domain-containing protein [Christensenellaceae bacterium]|nr:carbohydrate-binding domain-containing protein [Christensenellaceae bacterium]